MGRGLSVSGLQCRMRIRQTHTCAVLHVPKEFWDFVAEKLKEAGYDHVFSHDGTMIDMSGIGLVQDPLENENG